MYRMSALKIEIVVWVFIFVKNIGTVKYHCRGLQAIGVDSKSYSIILVHKVQKKLPEEIRLILCRKMNESFDDNDWELPYLLNCLRIEIEAREKCAPGKKEFQRVNTGYPTAAALTTR